MEAHDLQKMKLAVEITSKTTIKPHSPTPASLSPYQLSFLDQMAPPLYNSIVYFYKNDDETENSDKSNLLKKSLSEVLSRYYPLAGRRRDDIYIDCNDEGIAYIEAHVKCNLSDVIQDPIPGEFSKLLPFQADINGNEIFLGVQFNTFDCGGVAIGICLSHRVADGLSFFIFTKAWAATAREQDIICPQFGLSKLFPPLDLSGYNPNPAITRDDTVAKRFVFYAPKIEALKAKYAKNLSLEGHRPPTRVEALTAFIWSRYTYATQVESKDEKLHAIVHAVNLRNRMDPPLPDTAFGNLFQLAFIMPPVNNSSEKGYKVVSHIREEISKIDKNYVHMLQDGKRHLEFLKRTAEEFKKREIVLSKFSSWCRFPLYEADFGWGKPEWASPPLAFNNMVIFMDSGGGDAIEAQVNLSKEDMAKLESDNEFLAYASS